MLLLFAALHCCAFLLAGCFSPPGSRVQAHHGRDVRHRGPRPRQALGGGPDMFVSALTSLSQRKLFADARPDMFVSALTSLSQRKLFADAIACPDTICQVQVQSAVRQRVPEVCSEGASQVSGVVVVPEVGSEGASQVSGPEGASQVSGPDVPEVGSSIGQALPELTSDSGQIWANPLALHPGPAQVQAFSLFATGSFAGGTIATQALRTPNITCTIGFEPARRPGLCLRFKRIWLAYAVMHVWVVQAMRATPPAGMGHLAHTALATSP